MLKSKSGVKRYLSERENNINFVCQLGMVMAEHLAENLAQQIVILLQQSLVDFQREFVARLYRSQRLHSE